MRSGLYLVFTLTLVVIIVTASIVLRVNAPLLSEHGDTAKPAVVSNQRIVAEYGRLPPSFEANEGQTDRKVKFLSRGAPYSMYLTSTEAVLALNATLPIEHQDHANPSAEREGGPEGTSNSPLAMDILRMKLSGTNQAAKVVGEDEQPGKANYFIGNDPSKWRTNVATYGKVRYKDVYPNIDLVYYGNGQELEFDFVCAPGANPQLIQIRFDKPAQLHLASSGDLVETIPGGSIRIRKPAVYQKVNGAKSPIAAEFVISARRTIGFRLGQYDHKEVLVIDPVLVFSTFLGGSVSDGANAIATDAAGNVYVAGVTQSTDFPVTSGAAQSTSNATAGRGVAFVSKLDPSGTELIYSTYSGGTGGDTAYGVTVDSSGDAYVVGQTGSKNFPVTPGAFQTNFPGITAAFIAKLNPTGSALVYATYLGGNSTGFLCCDRASAVAIDSMGNTYVAGTAIGGFPVTPGAVQTTIGSNLSSNAFVTKINPAGSALVYSTFLGGSGQVQFNIGPAVFAGDGATALAVDNFGNAYVTGYAHSANFPVTAGAFQSRNKAATTSGGASLIPGYNAFVTKINPSGSALVFSTYVGGSGVTIPNGAAGSEIIFGDQANALSVDAIGNVYIAGFAYSADFPVTAGAFQTSLRAAQANQNIGTIGYNAFLTKLNPAGTTLIYSTFVGGSGADRANGLATDGSGDAYITGGTTSLDFPVTPGALQTVNKAAVANNTSNAFITGLNASGNMLIYSTYFGGAGIGGTNSQSSGDNAYSLALDSTGNIYIAGSTWSADFPATQGAFQVNNNATGSRGSNAFIAKLTAAQTMCTPPGVSFSFQTSGRITDASLNPIPNVSIYGGPLPVMTGADGEWNITVTGCTLSPPRCGTGFNPRLAPVRTGYSFTPNSGELCPSNVFNSAGTPSSFISVSAANYRDALAPESVASAFAVGGSTLAGVAASSPPGPLPEVLAGSRVTITSLSGFTISRNISLATLFYASPTQINFYLRSQASPAAIVPGPAEIQIDTADGRVLRSSTFISSTAPALFSANASGEGGAAAVIQRVKSDNSTTYEPVSALNTATMQFDAVPIDLGPETDICFLDLFGTGIRNRSSLARVSATIGGVPTQVVYAGPQTQANGLDQVNILLPRSLAGRGEMGVVLTVDGQVSNKVSINIRSSL